MSFSYKEFAQQQIEQEHINMIRSALVHADKFTVNQILKDLTVDEDNLLKKTFEKYFKIDGKFISEVDASLLDVPLIKISDRATFNGENLSKINEKQKRDLQIRENRRRGALKASQKRKIQEEEKRKVLTFWINDSEYILYDKPYHIMKELVFQLSQEVNKTKRSQLELLKISNLLTQFFK